MNESVARYLDNNTKYCIAYNEIKRQGLLAYNQDFMDLGAFIKIATNNPNLTCQEAIDLILFKDKEAVK